MQILERKLYVFIKELHKEIIDMKPSDGFQSPRDIDLVCKVNKKSAILDHMQKAMNVINSDFDINEKVISDKYLGIEFYDKFYSIIENKITPYIVSSGISLRNAVKLKKENNYYLTWKEAKEALNNY